MSGITTNLTNTVPPFGPSINGTVVFVFYEYRPNQAAAYAFVALFGLATIAQLCYLVLLQRRPWYFIPLIIGGIAETFGYYCRSMSATSPSEVGGWIGQGMLTMTAAPLLAATIYMIFARVVEALGASKLAILNPRWITRFYVLLDIIVIITQLAGTLMPASGDAHLIALSRKIVLAGLATQLVALTFFMVNCWQVHKKLRQATKEVTMHGLVISWQSHLMALEVATLLLCIRSMVRVVEYAQGDTGYVASHEVYIYVFDGALMFLIMLFFTILHPQRLVQDMDEKAKEKEESRMELV